MKPTSTIWTILFSFEEVGEKAGLDARVIRRCGALLLLCPAFIIDSIKMAVKLDVPVRCEHVVCVSAESHHY